MVDIFVNLKRFDVPADSGGICPQPDPEAWAAWVIAEAVRLELGHIDTVRIVLFFPEALLPSAIRKASSFPNKDLGRLYIGSQGVFRTDVTVGGNFGAFTTNLPAAAARNLGCTWVLVGHSEERKDKFEIMAAYDSAINSDPASMKRANNALHGILNLEMDCAFKRGMDVVFCVGETAEERGDGSSEEQQPRIREVLKSQLAIGLSGAEKYLKAGRELVIAYEPRWAIGPGKKPPGADYIGYVGDYIRSVIIEMGLSANILYGGGLKRENAASIAGAPGIGGGLVALTKFTQPVAFDPAEFKAIIEQYLSGL